MSIHDLWCVVIEGLQDIWPPGRTAIGDCNMGDVWPHSSLPQDSESSKLVSFHKLSQWLTYSMIEPLEDCGLKFSGLDAMTGLPEYRNGGLFVDLGVLIPKDAAILTTPQDPSSEVTSIRYLGEYLRTCYIDNCRMACVDRGVVGLGV